MGHAPQTILVQGGSSRPGIGQLAKEALVFGVVTAGVNAAVNRVIPGGIYGNSGHYGGGSSGNNGGGGSGAVGVPTNTHTQITYNNYYNNGSAPQPAADGSSPAAAVAPAAPVAPAAAVTPLAAGGDGNPPPVIPLPEQPTQNSNSNASPDKSAEGKGPQTEEGQFPSPLGYVITKAEIEKLSEDLLSKDKNNAFKHVTMSLQGQKMDDSVTDDAPES